MSSATATGCGSAGTTGASTTCVSSCVSTVAQEISRHRQKSEVRFRINYLSFITLYVNSISRDDIRSIGKELVSLTMVVENAVTAPHYIHNLLRIQA